jgi:CRP/FNR family transcriptional regulator, anaerobic regulatory protein
LNLSLTGRSVSRCEFCSIRHRSVCSSADPKLQAELQRISHIRHFKAGETVIGEDEKARILGNVVSGVLKLVKTMADGRQQIVGLLLPSDLFGRAFSESSHFAVEAATDVTLCCFERPAFENLLRRNPEIEHSMLLSVLDELDAARDWMVLLGCQTVLERVATMLLILDIRTRGLHGAGAKPQDAECVTVPISRRDMAIYLGTTVESISRAVQHLSRAGMIRILDPQHFEIRDRGRLIETSGREEFRTAFSEDGTASRKAPANAGALVSRKGMARV